MGANGPGVRHTRVKTMSRVFAMLPMSGECHHWMLEMKMSLHNVTFLAAVSTRSTVPRVQV